MPVSPASSSTDNCPAIPACKPPAASPARPAGPAPGYGSLADHHRDLPGLLAAGGAHLLSGGPHGGMTARRSARSWSLPRTSSVSFLRPASASCPTSHPTKVINDKHTSSLPATGPRTPARPTRRSTAPRTAGGRLRLAVHTAHRGPGSCRARRSPPERPHLAGGPTAWSFQDHGPDSMRHRGTSGRHGPDSVRQLGSACLTESGPQQVRAPRPDQIH